MPDMSGPPRLFQQGRKHISHDLNTSAKFCCGSNRACGSRWEWLRHLSMSDRSDKHVNANRAVLTHRALDLDYYNTSSFLSTLEFQANYLFPQRQSVTEVATKHVETVYGLSNRGLAGEPQKCTITHFYCTKKNHMCQPRTRSCLRSAAELTCVVLGSPLQSGQRRRVNSKVCGVF
ncbi:hypothetical protein F2P81_006447 [Scophthalmus maximus]|uniref:Uncharacterized protein n=1 Tax=Scophthalmus maximus TaxID=52904 RepID=A0A6A4T6Q0_SCOMX|nr:hypothetical protein F2P81_006447 [Scophthalmus maximus]